jgi:hypothetical protein
MDMYQILSALGPVPAREMGWRNLMDIPLDKMDMFY